MKKPQSPIRAAAQNLALLMATVLVFVGICELTLRLSGFSYVLYPEEIEFGRPNPVRLEAGFRQDEDLFWVSEDYDQKMARLRQENPPLIFMGDSCTQLGRYDEALADLVAQRQANSLPFKELHFGNLGVAGWSSFQGRRQLARDVLPLHPQVVTLYYGWNDHWIGFGIEDKNVARIKRVFSSGWSRLRLVQLVTKATIAYGSRQTGYPNRVSRDDFMDNLRTMISMARQEGVQPVLLTAASSHEPGKEPSHLDQRWLRDLSELVPLHQSYVEAVRQVAQEEEAVICDLAVRFEALPGEQSAQYFMADGIHLTPEGNRKLGEFLYDCFVESGIFESLGIS